MRSAVGPLQTAGGIQLLGPRALPPRLRWPCRGLACHSQVWFKNSMNPNFEQDFVGYFLVKFAFKNKPTTKKPSQKCSQKEIKITERSSPKESLTDEEIIGENIAVRLRVNPFLVLS